MTLNPSRNPTSRPSAAACALRHAALAALLAFSTAGLSAGDPSALEAPAAETDPVMERYAGFSKKKDWPGAAAVMEEALKRAPAKADYHNLYAYALRKGPRPDMERVFRHYTEALRLDPKHRGAHEYIGEAYLMAGNPAKAKEHLSVLDRLCRMGCEEYTDLKKAIAAYEARKK